MCRTLFGVLRLDSERLRACRCGAAAIAFGGISSRVAGLSSAPTSIAPDEPTGQHDTRRTARWSSALMVAVSAAASRLVRGHRRHEPGFVPSRWPCAGFGPQIHPGTSGYGPALPPATEDLHVESAGWRPAGAAWQALQVNENSVEDQGTPRASPSAPRIEEGEAAGWAIRVNEDTE